MRKLAIAPVVLLLASCSVLPGSPPFTAMHFNDVEIEFNLSITSGRTVQAVKKDINHIQVNLFKLQSGAEVVVFNSESNPLSAEVGYSGLDAPIRFSNLKPNTTYRARTVAYGAPGTAASDIISEQNDDSMTEIVVGSDTGVIIAPLKLRLLPDPFAGQGTSSLQIQEGAN